MKYKKERGQKRKSRNLLIAIDNIYPRFDYIGEYEHYHVPCGFWISSPKVSSKVQTKFSQKWIEKTKEIIENKPKNDKFCKVVASITYPNFWCSQIIIFYDEKYYSSFFKRTGPYQTWTKIDEFSFAKHRNINTDLKEQGYDEVLVEDEDEIFKEQIWFYGEIE